MKVGLYQSLVCPKLKYSVQFCVHHCKKDFLINWVDPEPDGKCDEKVRKSYRAWLQAFLVYPIHKKRKKLPSVWANLTINWQRIRAKASYSQNMQNGKSLAFLKTFFCTMWLKFKVVAPAALRSFPAGLPSTQAAPRPSRGFVSYSVGSLWRGKFGLSPGTSLFAGPSNRTLPVPASRDLSQASAVGEVFAEDSCSAPLWTSSDQHSSQGCSRLPHHIASPWETPLKPSSWKSSSVVFCSSALLAGLGAHPVG